MSLGAAQAARAQNAARRLHRLGREAARAAAQLAALEDGDIVAAVDVPAGAGGEDVQQIVAEATQTTGVTVVVIRNATTAPR